MKITTKQSKQVLALAKYLDRSSELLQRSRAIQKYFTEDVEILDFQTEVVDKAKNAKWFSAELATGIGKSIVAARVCAERLKKGPCLVVCPSSAALGDEASGIINKFVRTFSKLGIDAQFGELNDVSLAYDVSFVTPGTFAGLLKKEAPRIRKYLGKISTMVVDEAHHFPEDEDAALVVYGQIERAAKRHVKGLVFPMTGTWTRLDGKIVMGVKKPDHKISVQDAVDLGRAPPLYGIQVVTEVTTRSARATGDGFDLQLRGPALNKYYRGVVECILATCKKCPAPFAAFARTRQDAAQIARRFNRVSAKKMVVMDSGTPLADRKRFVQDIVAGKLAGYITCAVGEEALDIPTLEVVHLIRRTRSVTRNMQAIGRALRVSPGKKRALVVDYQTQVAGLQPRFVGLSIDDMVEHLGTRSKRKIVQGGPLVEQDNYDDHGITNIEMSLSEERVLLCKRKANRSDRIKAFLLEYAKAGNSRPTKAMKGWVTI